MIVLGFALSACFDAPSEDGAGTGGGTNNPTPRIDRVAPDVLTRGAGDTLLDVTGSGFVTASVARWNGAPRATTVESGSELAVLLRSADLAAAGTGELTVFNPAPGGGETTPFTLPIENPLPDATALQPASGAAGGADFALVVNGTGFVEDSEVRWSGAGRATAFVSATQLVATITAADIAAPGQASVTVSNPAPGGGVSDALTFTVDDFPTPIIGALRPDGRPAGAEQFELAVTGTSFVASSVIRWGAVERNTSFVSTTELRTLIDAAEVSNPTMVNVSVFTPGPGGGTSAALPFTVSPPTIITSLDPASALVGDGTFTSMTVNGANFDASTRVYWNGVARPTSFVSGNEVTVTTFPGVDIDTAGCAAVTASTTTGGTSDPATFTVDDGSGACAALPVLTRLVPGSVQSGTGGFALDVIGENFEANSIVRVNGSPRVTTPVSDTVVQAQILSGDVASEGLLTITVLTPGATDAVSGPETLFVLDAGEDVFYDNFNRTDNPDLDNDWIERNRGMNLLSLQGNAVSSILDIGQNYVASIVYRPESEDRRDAEVSIEFTRRGGVEQRFAQVHARIQRALIDDPTELHSYIFFVSDNIAPPGRATISVQPPGSLSCYMLAVPFATPLQAGERYRLRLRVSGTDPVVLTGTVDALVAGAWQVFATGTVQHDATTTPTPGLFCQPGVMPPPITTAGGTGFSRERDAAPEVYDNFYTRDWSP